MDEGDVDLVPSELALRRERARFFLQLRRELNNITLIAVMLVIVPIGVAVDRLVFGRVQERWGLA